jgi:hypothetical protein
MSNILKPTIGEWVNDVAKVARGGLCQAGSSRGGVGGESQGKYTEGVRPQPGGSQLASQEAKHTHRPKLVQDEGI